MNLAEAFDEQAIDWDQALSHLDERGFVAIPGVLSRKICEEIAAYYADDRRFRSRIEMSRYAFGQGEYKYFNYPLPPVVEQLRSSIYPELVPLANEWIDRFGKKQPHYPEKLSDLTKQCHRAGQKRATPLLLKYGPGDFNCLHQDLYGEIVFPFQVVIALSQPDKEFTGGELLLVEQQPRAQSIGHSIRLEQGETVVITTRYRPVKGSRGYYRT